MDAVSSRNPLTGEIVHEERAAGPGEVERAVRRAALGAESWTRTTVEQRAAVLRRAAELLEARADALSGLIVSEVGKLAVDARAEVAWTARTARWYADHPARAERRGDAVVRHAPLGVIAAITPWNVPLITPAWKWLPALMAGNAVLWKPSELATGTARAAAALLHEAGVPDEVLAVLPGGPQVARRLCAHPDVAGVHFTGSTRAGRVIARTAAARLVPCALELGGVNAAIVFADADLDAAAEAIAASATALAGQKCTSVRRVLIERPVHAALADRLAARLRALVPGDPAQQGTTIGPLITPQARRHAEQALARAQSAGARVLATSPPYQEGGAFFPATLLERLAPDDSLRREELFAPVLSVDGFDVDEQAWRATNDGASGLTAAVYTTDRSRAQQAAKQLRVAVLAVNRRSDAVALEAPFAPTAPSGNAMPEGGEYAYRALTALRAIYAEAD